jgi:hypothetical protein
MTESAVKVTPKGRVWLGADGVLRQQVEQGARLTGEDAAALLAATAELVGDRRLPILVLAAGTRALDREARLAFSGPESARLHSAVAIVVDSLLVAAIANFFTGLNRPTFPVKIFSDETRALRWLEGFRP